MTLARAFFFICLFVPQLARANFSQTWFCEEGDYHLAIQVNEEANLAVYEICEFADCSADQPTKQAVRKSSEKPNVFSIEGETTQLLTLSYTPDGKLNEVQRTNDSYVVQTFSNCKRD